MSRKIAIEILEKNGSAILRCNGNSMRPLFSPGEALHIRKVDMAKLRVGDAVFCKVNGGLQVHKISAIDKNERWQISNNRGYVNGWIGKNAIYGLCVKAEDRVIVSDEELNQR